MYCLISFCCVCLNESEPLEYLDNKDEDQIQLINKLKYCAFENHLMGHKPQYICSKCLQILKLAYEFKRTCRKSSKFIKKYVSKLTRNSKKKQIEQNILEVELIDIKQCVLFTNMAHTYANVDYDKNTERIEEIFLKNEPITEVKYEILDSNQFEDEFPQLIISKIKDEPIEDEINGVEFEIVDFKTQLNEGETLVENPLNETGFSALEIKESKSYFNNLRDKLNTVLKQSVYNNLNKTTITNDDPVFKCPICQASFPDCFLFHSHMTAQSCQTNHKKKQLGDKKFSCNICQKRFFWKGSLRQHILIHTGVKEHICLLCNRKFTQKSGLRRHMSVHNQDGAHKCKFCDKTLYNLSTLKTHMFHHQRIRPFSCPTCNKNFYQKGHLNVHMLTHNATKKYECRICFKTFNYKSNYKQHLELHVAKKDVYKCDECPKAFPLKASLHKHKKVHSGIRDHMCDVCSKRFICKSHLDRHMLVHNGERIHKCYLCPKTFIYDTALMTHIKSHFRGTVPETCEICSKSFNDPLALKRHKKIHLERKRNHKCPFCEKTFYTKTNVENHLVSHSGQRKFKCKICPKTYAYSIDLKRHLGTHEGKKTR